MSSRRNAERDRREFRPCRRGNDSGMIGAALGVLVVGIILLFVIPWVGIAVGAVGLVLVVLYFLGFGRRAAEGRP